MSFTRETLYTWINEAPELVKWGRYTANHQRKKTLEIFVLLFLFVTFVALKIGSKWTNSTPHYKYSMLMHWNVPHFSCRPRRISTFLLYSEFSSAGKIGELECLDKTCWKNSADLVLVFLMFYKCLQTLLENSSIQTSIFSWRYLKAGWLRFENKLENWFTIESICL